MSESKLMARIPLSPQTIRDLLHLPPGAEVAQVDVSQGHRGCVEFIVLGVGWPTGEGEVIQPAYATIHRAVLDDGRELAPRFEWSWENEAPAQTC